MTKITVSAPGKLLLLGDHAVVYGYPCLVTSVSQRLRLTVSESSDGVVHFDTPGVMDTRFLEQSLRVVTSRWKGKMPALTVQTESAFSGQYGFGSSSAVTVSMIFALSRYFGRKDSLKDLFDLAFQTILDVQGVGSGFDVASALYGGTLWYEKRGKIINMVKHSAMPLLVAYSGEKADTAAIVKEIATKRENAKERVERIFQATAQFVHDARTKMEEGDWERVGKLMDFNQEYLRDLGVSSEKLEAMIAAAKQGGAWGAKLSGAGRGDSMIALVPEEKRKSVEDAITSVGGQVIHITSGVEGVRVEL